MVFIFIDEPIRFINYMNKKFKINLCGVVLDVCYSLVGCRQPSCLYGNSRIPILIFARTFIEV